MYWPAQAPGSGPRWSALVFPAFAVFKTKVMCVCASELASRWFDLIKIDLVVEESFFAPVCD
jgi:hypothetical protein